MNHNDQVEHDQFATIAAGESPQMLYVDSTAEFVTTWPGTAVARIVKFADWTAYTPSNGYFERCYVSAVDLAGRLWRGYGMGKGMLCRMHIVTAAS